MKNADLVFKELRTRKDSVHRLLVNARTLAKELRGVAADNQKQIAPALKELDDLLNFLTTKEKELKATLAAYGHYADIQIGRAHVCTPVTNAHLVCRLLLEK